VANNFFAKKFLPAPLLWSAKNPSVAGVFCKQNLNYTMYMLSKAAKIIFYLLLAIGLFFSFYLPISQNKIFFSMDEMYWIQTARILPYMLDRKLSDTYWHEHMGFTNMNGAKWIYAIGMKIFGHTDFESIGNPPFSNQPWLEYNILPSTHALYPMLLAGRLISAFVASAALCGMFYFSLKVFKGNIVAAFFVTLLLRTHPIITEIGTHALADSMLFFAQVAWMIVSYFIIKNSHRSTLLLVLLGSVLGYAVSVKINGFMFYIVTVYMFAYIGITTNNFTQVFKELFVASFIMINTFLLLHPNLFFFPSYTLAQMLFERVEITKYHIGYFLENDPDHVILGFFERVKSLSFHVFKPYISLFFGLGMIKIFFLSVKKQLAQWNALFLQLPFLYIVTCVIIVYVVFDDPRYFMPVLPFVCLFCAAWIPQLKHSPSADIGVLRQDETQ
jgi:hypothetical protein